MSNRKDPIWKYGIKVETDEQKGYKYLQCKFCDGVWKGGVFRMKEHLAGVQGRGLKAPTTHELSTSLLLKAEGKTQAVVDEVNKTWSKTRVSIMSDGWKDIRGRQLINFLVNNLYNTVFLNLVNASDAIKDATLLFNLLDSIIEDVEEDIVVQVVTDNTSNYKKTGEMLMDKRKRLWWTPCAPYCIDLMLEKIGSLPQHQNALRKAKKVSNFIYNHEWVLALMRMHTNKELIRHAPTRFATSFLTLERLLLLRQPLEQMFCLLQRNGMDVVSQKKPGEGKSRSSLITSFGVACLMH
ncbi:hypothetical protein Ddye_021708 [Dipteronia dyeriana]|uniref:BED-type domain-containing protein n=1 Tax=Dipteronia dyeriana TaxID=168575 RepID=A0AAD9U2N3_9ROSI|nr:hypothetical protein Ddye_021708 [Dipteronia dyeriana]